MSKALKGLLKTPCSLALIQCLHLHYRCIVAIVQVFALVLLQYLACRPPTLLWTSLKNLSIPVTTSHHLQTGNRIFNCHWPDYLAKKSISWSITPTLCQSLTQGQYMKCGKTRPKKRQWLFCVTDVYNRNAIFSSPDFPMTSQRLSWPWNVPQITYDVPCQIWENDTPVSGLIDQVYHTD